VSSMSRSSLANTVSPRVFDDQLATGRVFCVHCPAACQLTRHRKNSRDHGRGARALSRLRHSRSRGLVVGCLPHRCGGAVAACRLVQCQAGQARTSLAQQHSAPMLCGRWRACQALVLAAALVPAAVSEEAAEAAQMLREGSAHAAADRHAEAVAALTEATALLPRNSAAHTRLGSSLARLGRLEEAIVATAKAADLAPRDVGVLITHGSLLQNSVDGARSAIAGRQDLIDERLQAAMAAFGTAREVAPHDSTAWMNSGIVAVMLSQEGKKEEHAVAAVEYALRANQLDPNPRGSSEKVLASAWAARAAAAGTHSKPPRKDEQREHCEKAIECYNRILEANPKDAFALHYRGARLENIGRWKEALSDFAAVTKLVPNDPMSWEAKALTHVHLSEYKHALEAAQRAIAVGATGTKLGGAHRSIGDAMGGLGRHSESEAA
jgi:tetratricopeptide (TPR) repeat protein